MNNLSCNFNSSSQCIAALISAPSLLMARELWLIMMEVFGSSTENAKWEKSMEALRYYLQRVPQDLPLSKTTDPTQMNEEVRNDEVQDEEEPAEVCENQGLPTQQTTASIREQSPFSKFFPKPNIDPHEVTPMNNAYFKPRALNFISKMLLPLFALWGQFALVGIPGIKKYLTNAKIESWFG